MRDDMGRYVDIDRTIIKKEHNTVVPPSNTVNAIYDTVPVQYSDTKRIVFFTQDIPSCTSYGIISSVVGLTIYIKAGNIISKSGTISWIAQGINIPPNTYGVLGINKSTLLIEFSTGLYDNIAPIALVGSADTTIGFSFQLGSYGKYVCCKEQILVDDKWTWSSIYSYILGIGSKITYANYDGTNITIAFNRHGTIFTRVLSSLIASDWNFYPDYIDNSSVRYLMPNTNPLNDTVYSTMQQCVLSYPPSYSIDYDFSYLYKYYTDNLINVTYISNTTKSTSASVYYGLFSNTNITVDNIIGTTNYVYTIIPPLYTLDSIYSGLRYINSYNINQNNNIVSNAYTTMTRQLFTTSSVSDLLITLNIDASIAYPTKYIEHISDTITLPIIKATVSPTETLLTQGVYNCISASTINTIQSTFAILSELYYIYKFYDDSIINSTYITSTSNNCIFVIN